MRACMRNWLVLAIGTSLLIGAAAGESLCGALAAEARRLPASAWVGPQGPFEQVLRIERHPPGEVPSALARELAQSPVLREALAAEPGWPMAVERLAGTDVYRADAIQGTANCQYSVFVEARPGAAVRRIDAPFDGAPCWTQSGAFGHPLGQAAYLVRGASSSLSQDDEIRLARWTGQGWGPACRLKLSFSKSFRLSGEFCSDAALCKAARGQALAIGKAYDLARQRDEPFDAAVWAAGMKPGDGLMEAMQRITSWSPTEFPPPGVERRGLDGFTTGYSNVKIQAFAWHLDGAWFVGLVGHAGVGWRESAVTLVSLFALADGQLKPVAGFQVEASRGELLRASADPQ